MQLDDLPVVLQEHVVAEVAQLGSLHIFNLRACSKQWRTLCNAHILSASVPAGQLATAIPFLKQLSRLTDVTIKGITLPAVEIAGDTLSSLTAKLASFTLTSGIYVRGYGVQDLDDDSLVAETHCYAMKIQNLGMMVLPSYLTLTQLHLNHCEINVNQGGTESGPGLFASLSCLRMLHINSCSASLNSQLVPWPLDLAGCSGLQLLDCSCSNVSVLTLSGCVSLETLICSRNQLTILNVSECECIRHIQCKFNSLVDIQLSATASLDYLNCGGRSQHASIAGGMLILELECTWATFNGCSFALRQRLERLTISRGSSVGALVGFQDLKFLACSFGEDIQGCLILNGCSNVELEVQDKSGNSIVVGVENIRKLTSASFGKSLIYLNFLTRLEELNLTLSHGEKVDLRGHETLRKVCFTEQAGAASTTRVVDLSGCFMLEELCCDNFTNLSALWVSGCVGLKSVSCTNSNLQRLDVSWSPLLTFLNVNGSRSLKHLFTSEAGVLDIRSEGCIKLESSFLKRVAHDSIRQPHMFAQRFVSSAVGAHVCGMVMRGLFRMLVFVAVVVLLGYIAILMISFILDFALRRLFQVFF